ncbi:VOC family protein [Nocardioides sp. URHA0020]|uniref:VOC family protein n=1 Tax=Nocardioides sp. URHA0020 TaxID=1380392 RepID=UPI00048C9F60|nr:VOC family protein [Nocardioides sp. URHA0020]
MSDAADVKHWQTLSFGDADAMMAWLGAIGFTEHATYRDETDPSVVVHAEWLWPGGGGVMFGSQRPDGVVTNVGGSAAYLVVDDPDALFDKAVAAGATVVREMVDQDYGGRGGSVEDPEGNHWSFGSYQPR